MSHSNTPFHAARLDEQIEQGLATRLDEPQGSRERTLQALHQHFASEAREAEDSLERVNQRLQGALAREQHSTIRAARPIPLPTRRPSPAAPPLWSGRPARLLQGLVALLLVGVLVGGFIALFASHHRSASQLPTTTGAWQLVDSPGGSGYLTGISVLSQHDIWAVGASPVTAFTSSGAIGSTNSQPLIQHWNGTGWRVVPGPTLSTPSTLTAVAAVSTNDVWAVGASNYTTLTLELSKSLIVHRDGARWNIVPGPDLGGMYSVLTDVTALSANDVWAVGSMTSPNSDQWQTLIVHWNGQQWSLVSSPSPGHMQALTGISAVSASDIWAVGWTVGPQVRGLIVHWNGQQWSVIPGANPGTLDSSLTGITALSANNAWAVGYTEDPTSVNASTLGKSLKTLIEHWDGQQWVVVPNPNVSNGMLIGVTAISTNNVWAAGLAHDERICGKALFCTAVIAHWDGTRWSSGPNLAPHPGWPLQFLTRIAHDPASGQLWAVGASGKSDTSLPSRPLIEKLP